MPRSFLVLSALTLVVAAATAGASGLCAQSLAGSQSAQKGTQAATSKASPERLSWPVILPKPPGVAPESDPGWTKDEIETARARCNAHLAAAEFIAMPSEPLREGTCGAPAAVELISVGKGPQVTLSIPSTVSCEMVAALDSWLRNEVQPAARELLGSPVVRIDVMSGYSCRNAYGRKQTKLSEHGRANALDIRSFMTQRGDSVEVLADWGATERDHKAQLAAAAAAAKAEAARAEAVKKEAEKAQASHDRIRTVAPSQGGGAAPSSTAAGTPPSVAGAHSGAPPPAPASASSLTAALPAEPALRGTVNDTGGVANDAQVYIPGRRFSPSVTLGLPSNLGGPKAKSAEAAPSAATIPSARQKFLRRVHAGACRIFGTTLGPETNEAHRNHFHVDMAERQSGSYCE